MTMPLDPTRTALLVMDFQTGIVRNLADPDELVRRTAQVLRRARSAGVRIAYVRVAFGAQDYDAVSPLNKSFAVLAGSGHLADGSVEAAIIPELAPEPGDIVVTKTRTGAFSTTNLAKLLNPRTTDNLILAGVSTSGVVLSTVRDAADRDYRLYVLADCCADPNAEVHRMLTEQVFPRQAEVITAATLPGLLGR